MALPDFASSETLPGPFPDCELTLESLPFVAEGARGSQSLASLVAELCKVMTIKAVAIFQSLHRGTVKPPSMFNRYNTVDREDAIDAMKRLNLFLSEQKSFKSSDDVQTGTLDEKVKGSEEPPNLLESLVPEAGVDPARWGTTEGF